MRSSKDVLVLQREKGTKLFLLALQLRNQPGALADLALRLERAKVNITTGFVGAAGPDGYGRGSFIVEAEDLKARADALRRAIEKSKFVAGVQIKESHNGLLVDSLNFPLSWNTGDRAVMLRAEFFTAMEEGIRKHFQSGADVVLYEMGYHHGEPTWRNLLKSQKVETLEDMNEVLAIYNAVGWGTPEVLSLDPAAKTADVAFKDNFECSLRKGQKGGSNFVRGHLRGFFEVAFGTEVQVTETRCVARGDEKCNFSVAPRPGPS